MTYTITFSAGSNTSQPIACIQPTDGSGTILTSETGYRWMAAGPVEMKYTPGATPVLTFTDVQTGRTMPLRWADLDPVTPAVLFGGLPVTIASLYDVWSNIADLGLARL